MCCNRTPKGPLPERTLFPGETRPPSAAPAPGSQGDRGPRKRSALQKGFENLPQVLFPLLNLCPELSRAGGNLCLSSTGLWAGAGNAECYTHTLCPAEAALGGTLGQYHPHSGQGAPGILTPQSSLEEGHSCHPIFLERA